MDAIRQILAEQLAALRAEADQLRAQNDDLRRTLIRERADRKAERDRQASAVRWSVP